MHRSLVVTVIVVITSLIFTAAASAAPIAPYDGDNPFKCKTQNTGLGVDFPDPDADPFCVQYDKTQQNVTDFGLVEFLLLEPARVAAAVPKCFYHQTDHWTGSVVQGQPPELWHWDGRYFFDKAKAVGGVSLSNIRLGGVAIDPRVLPGFPMQLWPYFGPGGGGARLVNLGAAEPTCAAKVDTPAEARRVYRQPPLY